MCLLKISSLKKCITLIFVIIILAYLLVSWKWNSENEKAIRKAQRTKYGLKFHGNIYNVQSETPDIKQAIYALQVIKRVTKNYPDYLKFELSVNSKLGTPKRETFWFHAHGGTVNITGNTGIAVLRGFYHYIKKYCSAHVSWEGTEINLPKYLPNAYEKVTAPEKYHYFGNQHLWSHSYAWWQLENDWCEHMDLLALNGVNLILAPIQEFITFKMYKEIGLTDDEIYEHLSGPGFFSWQRMGKINKWGGPISFEYLKKMHSIQKNVIYHMRKLGGLVAVPAFSGYVPRGLKRIFPNIPIYRVPRWNKFTSNYSNVYFIEPKSSLFRKISDKFLEEVIYHFGTDHIYFSEPVNALKSRDEFYYTDVFTTQYRIMRQFDPGAMWLVQSSVFTDDDLFWTSKRIKSFLSAIPIGRMLILDDHAENFPQYVKTNSFYGHPFVWCMQHNIGGTLGLYGSVDVLYDGILEARKNEDISLLGIGATPEGIKQNYVMYELLYDIAWDKTAIFLTDDWIEDYSNNRYGVVNQLTINAWKLLMKSVYNYQGRTPFTGKYIYNVRPRLNNYPLHWYQASTILSVWEHFLNASSKVKNDRFLYDLVDVTRQGLSDIADQIYIAIINAYEQRNIQNVRTYRKMFTSILYDIEKILLTNSHFLLEKWLVSARSFGKDQKEKDLFEHNARNQITIWGPNGDNVDYANRQWADIVTHFFKPRWELFFDKLEDCILKEIPYNEAEVSAEMLQDIEIPFTKSTKVYSMGVQGKTVPISQELYKRWSSYSSKLPPVQIINIAVPRETLSEDWQY